MRKLVIILLLLPILTPIYSCRKEEEVKQILLPVTHILTIKTKWGVITSPFLRLRKDPSEEADLVTTFWNRKNVILEIISQTSARENIDDQLDYWYQISYDGLTGWVFGSYIEVFTSRDKAVRRSRELN